jgi:sec-independent protein translocase protein TatC
VTDAPEQPKSDSPEDHKMSLLDHLIELRRRLMWSMLTLLVTFSICAYFSSEIFAFLSAPLREILKQYPDAKFIYTKLYEAFFAEIKIGFYAGAFLAFPVFAWQIYKFIAPGLYKNERKALLPFLIATPLLFFAGAAMVYLFIMPMAWSFFASFQGPGSVSATLLPRVEDYLSLSIRLIFAFGLAFQMPVALSLLAKAGIVSAQGLAKARKYAIVIVFAAAAILTPPDVLSQFALATPLLLLYEISIILARMIEKKRAARDAEIDAETAGTGPKAD